MITFKPDKKLRTNFPGIDFYILSLVYSLLYDSSCISKRRKNFEIELRHARGQFSFYYWRLNGWEYNARLNISSNDQSERQFHSSLLHEFRHFIQDNVYKIPFSKKTYDESTNDTYMASPVEIDARAYEKQLLSKVIRMYERLNKQKKNVMPISVYKGNKL